MNNNKVVVGIGEVLWDVFPAGKKLGGAPSNFAFHAAQYGFESYAVSALGADALGAEILEVLDGKPINKCFPTVDFPTGTVQVTLDEKGIPCYEIMTDVAWDNIPFTPQIEALAAKADCVCFGSLAQRSEVSRTTISRFVSSMREEGTLRVFDINLRQDFYSKEVIESSIKMCNTLKINDDELELITPMFGLTATSQADRSAELRKLFDLDMVILTCGTNGSYVFSANESSFLETPIVEVVDTVGAGDSFTSAFCSSILLGKSIKEAHQEAIELSAFVCSQSGAMPVRR